MTKNGAHCKLIAALLLLPAVVLPVQADLYRWVDENGRVHYSDTPPPASARSEKEIKSAPRQAPPEAPSAAPEQAQKTYVDQEAEFRKRRLEQAEREADAQKAQEAAEAKKRNCEQSRSQLAALKTGGRLARTNAQGEREYMDDQQIAQEIGQAEKAIAVWCN